MLNHLVIFFRDRIARAIGAAFAVLGISFGTWAAFIPYIKNKLVLDEAELGLMLLMLPLGAALMNPFCVPLIRRLGTVQATIYSILFVSVGLIFPIYLNGILVVGFSMFVFGMGYSAANITINTCASQLEAHSDKNIISTCHGVWSGGVMIGSAMAGLSQGAGIHPRQYVFILMAVVLVVLQLVKKPLSLLPDEHIGEVKIKTGKAFLRPNKALWTLIIIGLCINFAEGSMADWAAVYIKEVMNEPASVAGFGFSIYAFFMMCGRLSGDGLIAKYGRRNLLLICSSLTVSGYLIAVFAPNLFILIIGFSLIGLGVSLGSPILYASAARVPGLPKGAGLAIYTTYAMIGFLGGPVLVGFIAKAFSLPKAFLVVAAVVLLGLIMIKRSKKGLA